MITIKPVIPDYIESLLKITEEAWIELYALTEHGLNREDILALGIANTENIKKQRRLVKDLRPNIIYLAAVSNGRPVGYILCVSQPEETNWQLKSIYIEKEYRQKGIGRMLFTEALRELYKKGCTKLRLEVLLTNMKAVSFYKKMGWNDTRKGTFNIGYKTLKTLQMEYDVMSTLVPKPEKS